MATTISALQSLVRFHARDSVLTITSGDNLAVLNKVYQEFSVLRRFPETTAVDTSITTTAGQATYTWVGSPVFKYEPDPPSIEIIDASSNNTPCRIRPAADEDEWTYYDFINNQFPVVYRLLNISGVNMIVFRPTPDATGDTVRVTGRIEPDALTSASPTTVFLNLDTDNALAMWVAAEFLDQRSFTQDAMALRNRADMLLPKRDRSPTYGGGGLRPWQV